MNTLTLQARLRILDMKTYVKHNHDITSIVGYLANQ